MGHQSNERERVWPLDGIEVAEDSGKAGGSDGIMFEGEVAKGYRSSRGYGSWQVRGAIIVDESD